MYGVFGGCSTLFHLFVRHPLAVSVLGLSVLATYSQSQPLGPGQRMGSDAALSSIEHQLLNDNPGLAKQLADLRADFDRTESVPTEEDIRSILRYTDACTDVEPRDILRDDQLRDEAGWLYYLDTRRRVKVKPK
jgi:hypothetical protein